jgi:NAD(P)-dependent dehydrogenase (short-subunit alcohol dehydrogenase family)
MHVLITGASRGVGRALADHYRAAGHRVTGTARDGSGDAVLDVAEPESHAALARSLEGAPIDLLVCNAGIYVDKGQDLDGGYPAQMWRETFDVNVTGVFLSVQAMLPGLRAARGKVAIISSQMGSDTRALGGSYIYRASKAAALNLGRNLASDLAADGIAVGIYHPGWVRTDMGTGSADITVEESAEGLAARFAALDLRSTGCFETWDGRAHPF